MLELNVIAASPAAPLLGDLHPLVAQLGAAELASSGTLDNHWRIDRVQTVAELRTFVARYRMEVLLPLELPAIHQAWEFASRREARELIALDQEFGRSTVVQSFAFASAAVGQGQLRRLRPLKDERIVQRYWAAIEKKEAQGWHTLVYGLILSLYTLPARQGLLNYALQTQRGLVLAAATRLRLSEPECDTLLNELNVPLPNLLNDWFAARSRPLLTVA